MVLSCPHPQKWGFFFLDINNDERMIFAGGFNPMGFLAKLGIDYKALGADLIGEAREAERKQMQESAIGEVRTLMHKIQMVEAEMERGKESLKIYNGRLKAIDAGDFTIKFDPQYGNTAQIIYNDKELNVQR